MVVTISFRHKNPNGRRNSWSLLLSGGDAEEWKPREKGKFKGIQRVWQWHPTPVLLPGKSHGRRSLVGCSPWGREESDMTERLYFHFSLSCIGEGNGNPLQYSCLENPRDGGAWWAAVYGVAQSRTRLKRLSSSSSSECGRGEPVINNCLLGPTRPGGTAIILLIFFLFGCAGC